MLLHADIDSGQDTRQVCFFNRHSSVPQLLVKTIGHWLGLRPGSDPPLHRSADGSSGVTVANLSKANRLLVGLSSWSDRGNEVSNELAFQHWHQCVRHIATPAGWGHTMCSRKFISAYNPQTRHPSHLRRSNRHRARQTAEWGECDVGAVQL